MVLVSAYHSLGALTGNARGPAEAGSLERRSARGPAEAGAELSGVPQCCTTVSVGPRTIQRVRQNRLRLVPCLNDFRRSVTQP